MAFIIFTGLQTKCSINTEVGFEINMKEMERDQEWMEEGNEL